MLIRHTKNLVYNKQVNLTYHDMKCNHAINLLFHYNITIRSFLLLQRHVYLIIDIYLQMTIIHISHAVGDIFLYVWIPWIFIIFFTIYLLGSHNLTVTPPRLLGGHVQKIMRCNEYLPARHTHYLYTIESFLLSTENQWCRSAFVAGWKLTWNNLKCTANLVLRLFI